MQTLFNSDRFIVVHVFLFSAVISSIINVILTEQYLGHLSIALLNTSNLGFVSLVVAAFIMQKWKFLHQASSVWMVIFTLKLISVPIFGLIVSHLTLSAIFELCFNWFFLLLIVNKRTFLNCLLYGSLAGGIYTAIVFQIFDPNEIKQYSLFITDELHVIFSGGIRIASILILVYYKHAALKIRSESISRFSNVIAHDIFTPLAVIEANLALINDESLKKEQQNIVKNLVAICRTTRERINFLMQNIKMMSEVQFFKENKISVKEVLQECVEESSSKNFSIILTAHNDIKLWSCRSIFKCVVLNIIHNAFQHGGADINLEIIISGNYLIFQDNGRGIPASRMKDIFSFFSSSEQEHLGVGLSICQEIIKSFGGDIRCISLEGHHTTFIIKLPQA